MLTPHDAGSNGSAEAEWREKVDSVYRAESPRVLSTLNRLLGDFDLAEEALQSVRDATTPRFESGRVAITDGPIAETKEQLGGITVLQAQDLDQAIKVMSRHPSIQFGGTWEIRPAADLTAMVAASQRRRSIGQGKINSRGKRR